MLRNLFFALCCACAWSAVMAAEPAVSNEETRYIRDALVKQGEALGLDKSPELERLVTEFRQEQLANLALKAASDKGMPDFNARAEEIYLARKDQQYTLPLSLRVRVLELHIPEGKEAEVRQRLEAIRSEVLAAKTDFAAAVMKHSEAANLSLTKGDSFWFNRVQQPNVFAVAEQLTPEKPLSEIFVLEDSAYLLYFLDRKAPEIRSLEAVKPEIIAELQQEYRQQQQHTLRESLHEAFKREPAPSQNAAK